MGITIKDVAESLGVSMMTVSKVLNRHPDISQGTRERVLAKVAELGYRPNVVARSLATRRTHTLGVVVPDLMHSFFAEVAVGVESVAVERGYYLLICNTGEDPEKEIADLRVLQQRQVDGIILASVLPPGKAAALRQFVAEGVNLVLVDREPAGLAVHRVLTDDEQVGRLATEHLINLGHRRIGHLTGPKLSTAAGRERGYRRAMRRHRLEVKTDWVVARGFMQEKGYTAMQQLLRVRPRVTAVFAVNDPTAIGAIKAIEAAGLRIPDDLSVVGAGNIQYSDMLRVPLTTVGWPTSELGRRAATLLIAQIEAESPSAPGRAVLEPHLIVRHSSGPA